MKRMLSLILSLALLLSLAACGGDGDGERSDSRKDPQKDPQPQEQISAPEKIGFTLDMKTASDGCVLGENIYLFGEESDSDTFLSLWRVPLAGGRTEKLPEYQPPMSDQEAGELEAREVGGLLRSEADGTLWLMERLLETIIDRENGGLRVEEVYILRRLDGDGRELERFTYSGLPDRLDMGMMRDFLVDGDGDVFVKAENAVALLDPAGEVLFSLEANGDDLVRLTDGRIGVANSVPPQVGGDGPVLRIIDKVAQDWAEESYLLAGSGFPAVYDGDADALFYYRAGSDLRVWRENAKEDERLLNLADIGVDTELKVLLPLSDGRLVLLTGGYTLPLALQVLSSTDIASDKKVLTYASLQLTGDQQAAIAAFNRSSTEYRISVTDYSQYGDRQAALTRLVTEISAGKMPDILDLYGIPVTQWAINGYFEDLWPYIEKDPELGREALMDRVLEAAEIGGKLYEVGPSFSIATLTGAKDVVGDRMTWTGDELWAALEKMPEDCVPTSSSRANMLDSILSQNWSRFVDWEAGTCDFDCDEFTSLLAFCSRFPEKGTVLWERGIYEKRQMLLTRRVSGFYDPQAAKFLLGGEISYVGYPNDEGRIGSSFSMRSSTAMSSACRDKAGAWSFLRTLLLPHERMTDMYSYFDSTGFPINRSDFEKQAEIAMTPKYEERSGEKYETWKHTDIFDGIAEVCTYYAVTQEEYDQIMALYNSVGSCNHWDERLTNIIQTAVGPYFAGDISAEEASRQLQGRVELYLGEQG